LWVSVPRVVMRWIRVSILTLSSTPTHNLHTPTLYFIRIWKRSTDENMAKTWYDNIPTRRLSPTKCKGLIYPSFITSTNQLIWCVARSITCKKKSSSNILRVLSINSKFHNLWRILISKLIFSMQTSIIQSIVSA
jgi:hypothetical protein